MSITAERLRKLIKTLNRFMTATNIQNNVGISPDTYDRLMKRDDELTGRTRDRIWEEIVYMVDTIQSAVIDAGKK